MNITDPNLEKLVKLYVKLKNKYKEVYDSYQRTLSEYKKIVDRVPSTHTHHITYDVNY